MGRQTSIQVTDATHRQVGFLRGRGFGTFTDIVRIAIDRMFQQENVMVMSNFAPVIYETPQEWGSETVYADRQRMEETITGLIDSGGQDWAGSSLSECRLWQLEKSAAGIAVYQLTGTRSDVYAVFTEDGGFYNVLAQYAGMADVVDDYPSLA